MKCDTCKIEMLTIKELTDELPHTYDYDRDGFMFKVCPQCLECHTFSTKDTQFLQRMQLLNLNVLSTRDKKFIIHKLAHRESNNGNNGKKISETFRACKDKTDKEVIEIIAKSFNISSIKITQMFYSVKIKRIMSD